MHFHIYLPLSDTPFLYLNLPSSYPQVYYNLKAKSQEMANIEYLTRTFVHIPEPPPASRWFRMGGPRIENVNLAAPPITEAEIWEKRQNPFLLDLLVEIKENEYKEGW